MMKQFTNEVASYMAEGWLLVPNNTSFSNCVISVKLEREGERHTLRIMDKMETRYSVYTMESVNESTGETLEQQSYYYLWEWRSQAEDNHYMVDSLEEMVEVVDKRNERGVTRFVKQYTRFTPTRKLNARGFKTTKPEQVTITRFTNGYKVQKAGGKRDLVVNF